MNKPLLTSPNTDEKTTANTIIATAVLVPATATTSLTVEAVAVAVAPTATMTPTSETLTPSTVPTSTLERESIERLMATIVTSDERQNTQIDNLQAIPREINSSATQNHGPIATNPQNNMEEGHHNDESITRPARNTQASPAMMILPFFLLAIILYIVIQLHANSDDATDNAIVSNGL